MFSEVGVHDGETKAWQQEELWAHFLINKEYRQRLEMADLWKSCDPNLSDMLLPIKLHLPILPNSSTTRKQVIEYMDHMGASLT